MRVRTFLALATLAWSGLAHGQNIDVSTLPSRDSVQLTIYNAEDLTLVRETRHVTVRKGRNELQFSWANTLIDPTSVLLRFTERSKELDVVDTRLPADRPQTLYWTVRSEFEGDAVAEISYFTSGISWSADYAGVVNDASSLTLDGFVTISNRSGEDYEGANVRMVVGTINLVEEIADLARRGLPTDPGQPANERDQAKKDVVRRVMRAGKPQGPGGFGGGAMGGEAGAKEVEKEGLSEYFLFTVPGEETIRNGWSKRMRLFSAEEGSKVPYRVEYRYRPQEYGDQLVRMLLVRNDEASSLGSSPLPDGMVRLFSRTSDDGLGVLAFVPTKYVPIGQEFEFNLGRDPEVILERLVLEQSRSNFWFRRGSEERLYSPEKGDRIEGTYSMSGWDDRAKRVERIRNYRREAITVSWRFPLGGDVQFVSRLSPALFDYRTPEFSTTVSGGETKDLAYEAVTRQGTNTKQQRVELENVR